MHEIEFELTDSSLPKEYWISGVMNTRFIRRERNLIDFKYSYNTWQYGAYILYITLREEASPDIVVEGELISSQNEEKFYEVFLEKILNKDQITIEIESSILDSMFYQIAYIKKQNLPDNYYLLKEYFRRENECPL